MNINYEEIKKIIENDCEIAGQYYYDGKTCVIGALALNAGVEEQTLQRAGSMHILEEDNPYINLIADAIEKKFGLSISMQKKLQQTNDAHKPVRNRRLACLLTLEEIVDCVDRGLPIR